MSSSQMVNKLNQSSSNQYQKITFEIWSQKKASKVLIEFPIQILKFNIQILNNNHDQPYPIPKQIVNDEYPFQIMREYLQSHAYCPDTIKIIKPINSNHYQKLVDPITNKVLSKFTSPQNAQKIKIILDLTRFIRFHQLHDAICVAIATNYYIPPNDQKQLNQFRKIHKIDQLSSEQVCQIIKQYEDIFVMIQAKAKQQFLNSIEKLKHNNN